MKILFVCTTDSMIWNFLIPHIKDLETNGHTVECACSNTGFYFDELISKHNIKMNKIDFKRNPFKMQNFKAYKQLRKLVKSGNFEMVHCHEPVGGFLGRIAGRDIKTLYTAHGFHFFKGNSPIKNFVFKNLEKFAAKYTDCLITINEEDYQAALKFKLKKGGKVYKINGIGINVDRYNINFDKDQKRKELGLAKDDIVLIMVAEFIKRKNHITFIKAVNEVKNVKLKVLLCGTGKLESDIKTMINEYKLNDVVTFLGFRTDLNELLSISDIFIFPSYQEGLSVALMEAMASGLPVIASKIRGNIDLIDDNMGGKLIVPDDIFEFVQSINLLVKDIDLRKKYGMYNFNKIKNFSIDKIKNVMKEVYLKIEGKK